VRIYFEPGGEINTLWDQVIFWTLCGLILVIPLCLGAPPGLAWAETLFMSGAAVVGLSYAMKLLTSREQAMRWSWTYVPIAIFLALVLFQIVPLPASLVRIISPATLKLRTELMSDIPGAAERLKTLALTFYLDNSLSQLRIVFSVIVIFVVTLNEFRRIEQIRRLLLAIACIGGAIGIVALLQDITHASKYFWLIESDTPNFEASSGPFRNHSHFSQFMSLAIGAAIALALLNYKQTVRGTYSAIKERLTAREYQLMFAATAVIVICALAIFLSVSRSGMIALAASGLLTMMMIARKQHIGPVRAIVGALAMVVIVIAVVLTVSKIRAGIVQLAEHNYSISERQGILKALPKQWAQYPIFGSGLGAFEYVFPLFDVSRNGSIATHAENEYAQLMTEMGGMGVAMAIWFIAMVAWAYVRTMRKGSSDAAAIAIGMGYGVLAILIQSVFDFGQHLPANAMLMAVSCAILLNLPKTQRRSSEVKQEAAVFREGNVPLRATAAAALLLVFAWSIWSGIAASIAQDGWKKANNLEQVLRVREWQGDKPMFARLVDNAERAVRFAPRNVLYRHWLNVYRWYAGAGDLPRNPDGSLANGEAIARFCDALVADLNEARWLCPTFAPNYAQIGWYESFMLERNSGGAYLRTAYRLSPNDPSIVYRAGQQEAFDGHDDRSVELLNRSVELDPRLLSGVMSFYLHELKKPQLALGAARGNINAMAALVNRLEQENIYPDVLASAKKELDVLYESEAAKPGASPSILARAAGVERQAKRYDKAIDLYRRALAQDYGDVGTRLELAQTLLAMGKNEEARHEAQICLRHQPHFGPAEEILAQTSEDHPHTRGE
jgi:O-antigen ligase/tetratricopeptide (TPR) repeat protein